MRLLGHAMARPGVGVVTSHELAAVQLLQFYPYSPLPVPTPTVPLPLRLPLSLPLPLPLPLPLTLFRRREAGR